MTKKKWTNHSENGRGEPIHYYASSIADWAVDTDLDALISRMKGFGYSFNLYRVNGPSDRDYMISNYVPDLPSNEVIWIAFFEVSATK